MHSCRRPYAATAFITFDESKCSACWKCIARCHRKVIGKVNLIIHKHAILRRPSECTGCLKCVRICDAQAILKITAPEE